MSFEPDCLALVKRGEPFQMPEWAAWRQDRVISSPAMGSMWREGEAMPRPYKGAVQGPDMPGPQS